MALLCVIDIKTKNTEKYNIFEVTHTWFKLQILTLCVPMDCSLPGSSVRGIFQARVLEWVAIFFSRESSQPRDGTRVSSIIGRLFTVWATREAPKQNVVYTYNGMEWLKGMKFWYMLQLGWFLRIFC